MRPEFDRSLFSHDVHKAMERIPCSYREAVCRFPLLNVAMLNRAKDERRLSVESFLAICDAFALDPLRYLPVKNRQSDQAVTAIGKRETSGS
jgi:hypothetical protein